MAAKTLFKNFIIITGQQNAEPYKGDLLIADDRIIKIGQIGADLPGVRVIQGNQRFIFPGFIDLHSHGDLMNFASEGLSSKLKQGITTEVVGQCGVGLAPIREELKTSWQNHMIIRNPLSEIPWNTVAEYFKKLQQVGLDNNLIYFLPHGLLRYNIKRESRESMNPRELEELKALTVRSFKEGAAGLSLGLCYYPARYADSRELKTIFELADQYNRPISIHLRSEATGILEALDEIIRLAEGTRVRVNISHLKVIGSSNEARLAQLLEKIDDNGFSFDSYPYSYGNTTLEIIIPPDFIREKGLDSLKDKKIRDEIKEIYKTGNYHNQSWDNLPYLLGWENIYLSSHNNQDITGLSIQEISKILCKDPADTAFDLLLDSGGQALMQDYFMREEVIEKILKNKNASIGTDSLFSRTNQHLRTSSTYPKILKEYVFKKKLLTLNEAIYKFSRKPAEILELKDRGQLESDRKADLVIFSKDELLAGTGNGIQSVMVNGRFKLEDGIYHSRKKPGEILKK